MRPQIFAPTESAATVSDESTMDGTTVRVCRSTAVSVSDRTDSCMSDEEREAAIVDAGEHLVAAMARWNGPDGTFADKAEAEQWSRVQTALIRGRSKGWARVVEISRGID